MVLYSKFEQCSPDPPGLHDRRRRCAKSPELLLFATKRPFSTGSGGLVQEATGSGVMTHRALRARGTQSGRRNFTGIPAVSRAAGLASFSGHGHSLSPARGIDGGRRRFTIQWFFRSCVEGRVTHRGCKLPCWPSPDRARTSQCQEAWSRPESGSNATKGWETRGILMKANGLPGGPGSTPKEPGDRVPLSPRARGVLSV